MAPTHFRISQPGTYDVVVTLPGFKTFSSRGITVNIGAIVRVDARLGLGHSRRVGRRNGRGGDSAGRQRGAAIGDDGTGTPEPADQRSQLSEPAHAHSRCGAALVLPDGRHQQPVTFDAGIGEWATRHQHGLPARRHVGDQSVDSGTSGLQSRHRSDRNREHRHEQLRGRPGNGRWRRRERSGQERHEFAARFGIRVLRARESPRTELLPAGHEREAEGDEKHLRRHDRRANQAGQAFLLRQSRDDRFEVGGRAVHRFVRAACSRCLRPSSGPETLPPPAR